MARFAPSLLASTCLVAVALCLPASPAHAAGGSGGTTGGGEGAGGVDQATGAGGAGGDAGALAGGGGGGAGVTGGAGGVSFLNGSGRAAGGATAGAAGADGTAGTSALEGGGGGGGGAHGYVGSSVQNTAVTGGAGGAGGPANSPGALEGGGGGGAGGWGAVLSVSTIGSVSGVVTGGAGGAGGFGSSNSTSGSGGSGGTGLFVTSGGGSPTLSVSGDVAGGAGGASGGPGGTAGAGGVGIIVTNLRLRLSAQVTGGLGGDGVTRANAIVFNGTTNLLIFFSGASVVGGVSISGTTSFSLSTNAVLTSAVSGSGNLVKTSSGRLTLGGDSSYSGTTTISAGTLQVGNGATMGTLGGGAVINNGTLEFNRSNSHQVGNAISGTGTLTQAGIGTLILTGANTYSGSTIINSGSTLQVGLLGTTGTLGSGVVTNDGSLTFNRSDVVTVANQISGTGSLSQAGAGTLVLTGANTYTGTTFVDGGTLQVGAGGTTGTLGSGNINNSAVLAFNRSDTVTVANLIAGGGTLTQAGVGTTILTGANTYFGGTTISAGTVQVGAGGGAGSLGTGPVANNGALEFNRGTEITVEGAISGSGSLRQVGAGTLTLIGANTYSGTTTIEDTRRIEVGNGGASGTLGSGGVAIGTLATLAFNRSDTGFTHAGSIANSGTILQRGTGRSTLTGVISGSGVVAVEAGTLVLGGTNTYTGATNVTGGTLVVNGSINNSASLNVSGTGIVGGSGTLTSLSVGAGGTVSPGNSIGTLNVLGNLTLAAGSTTVIEVEGARADRINATGTASLGGTLRLVPLGGTYTFNAPYTLIQAASVTGSFDTVNTAGSFGAGVTSQVDTTATQVRLTLTPVRLLDVITPPAADASPSTPAAPAAPGMPTATRPDFGIIGAANQRSVAGAFDRAVAAGGNVSAFFPLYNLQADQLPRGLDQLSGQVHTAGMRAQVDTSFQVMRAMLDPERLRQVTGRYTVWASGFGGGGRLGGAGGTGSVAVTGGGGGVAVGADAVFAPGWMVGFALAGAGTQANLGDGLGRAESNQIVGGVYALGQQGPLLLGAALTYSGADVTTRRNAAVLGAGSLRGKYTSEAISTRFEAGWQFDGIRPGFSLTPGLAFQGSWSNTPDFTETATGALAPAVLAVAGRSQGTSRFELGLRADLAVNARFSGFGRVAWAAYTQRDAGMSASLTGLPGSGFTLTGARPDAHSALLSAGFDWRLAPAWTMTARVDTEFSSNTSAASGTARLRYAF